MSDLNTEERLRRSQEVTSMVQDSPGWKWVSQLIEEKRRDSFSEWSGLEMSAPHEKTLELKATEKVLKDLVDEIKHILSEGVEAQQEISVKEARQVEIESAVQEQNILDKEREALR